MSKCMIDYEFIGEKTIRKAGQTEAWFLAMLLNKILYNGDYEEDANTWRCAGGKKLYFDDDVFRRHRDLISGKYFECEEALRRVRDYLEAIAIKEVT